MNSACCSRITAMPLETRRQPLRQRKESLEHGGVSNFTGDLHTLIEIENQKYMAVYLKDKVEAREPLSVELVRAVHKKLMDRCYDSEIYAKGERAGEFKKGSCAVRVELENVHREADQSGWNPSGSSLFSPEL